MLTGVLIINLLISLLGFYIAVKVWKVRRILERFEARIAAINRCTRNILTQSPDFLGKRQQAARQLRRDYLQLELQLQQVQQLLGLLGLGRRLWRRRVKRSRSVPEG
jgi:tRNA U38,U39,U40 pseudouridine synthase TruA